MDEKTTRLEVVKKRCRISAKVVRVLQILALVGVIGAAVGAVLCFTMKDTINQGVASAIEKSWASADSLRFEEGLFHLDIDYDSMFREGNYAIPAAINCVAATLITAAAYYVLSRFRKIFQTLEKEENPFLAPVIKGLKSSITVTTVFITLFIGLGPGIIFGLLGWCIYSVFEYGSVLQTEVDETL